MIKSAKLVVIVMFANGWSVLMDAARIDTALGIEVQLLATSKAAELTETAQNLTFGANLASLAQIITTGILAIQTIIGGAFAAPDMLISLGVPTPIVVFITAPLAIIIALDLYFAATGRPI